MASLINTAIVILSLFLVFVVGMANVHGDAPNAVLICDAIAVTMLISRDVFQAKRNRRTAGVRWVTFLLIVVNALAFVSIVILSLDNHFHPDPYVGGPNRMDWARSVANLAIASLAGYFWYVAGRWAKSAEGAK